MDDKFSPLQPQWQNKAWKQFLMAKKDMLHAYDREREKGLERPVHMEHGRVAEAEFRKWLANFLPKKYAVTSGYIISQGTTKKEYLVHYDVIIYEHLEAPILWVDDHSDHSQQGKSMAIPVEYVRGVIEVKSSFSKKTAADAVSQLAKLKPLLQKIDPPHYPTKLYLPKGFFCAVVFFELRKENFKEFGALDAILEGTDLRGFYGGFILRCETLDEHYGGKLSIVHETGQYGHENTSLSFWSYSKSKKLGENLYRRILLTHCESFFSQFAFDMIALLKGTYHPGVISSLYGFGTTDMYNGKATSIRYHDIEEYKRYEEPTRGCKTKWFKNELGDEK
ncbi:DUF6602 domain-containing protein [Sphingobacterium thalpophilum]|uniref:DUF6602 domain-containing protein n=1 Tax=Sphingobacterium thalpophilum TaxID=259 RepID=A0ABV4HJS2_9SPHI